MIALSKVKEEFTSYFIWVLAPAIENNDVNISYYYDFSSSIAEYELVFKELGIEWKWQPVTLHNFKDIISQIASDKKKVLVLNLCDGDEINGAPGISVIYELEKHQLPYSGANASFYAITTSKIPMKQAFDKAKILTPNWKIIKQDELDFESLIKNLSLPLLIKPAVSGGSMGVGIKNVVHDKNSFLLQLKKIYEGYNGWILLVDGLIVEEFIQGREFTTFITGSYNKNNCFVYEPVERVFHSSLSETEKFLSFDRLWEIYEEESPMPNQESFYNYGSVEKELAFELKKISVAAYAACGGTGYSRIDIRQDAKSKKLFVLEVNAQCGLSADQNQTSIGAILSVSGKSFTSAIVEILQDALVNKNII